MATIKKVIVKTTDGNIFVLGTFGMVSKLLRNGSLQRFVARSEVKRCLSISTRTEAFQGDQFWPKNKFFSRFQPHTWRFTMRSDNRAEFGCQHFSITETKKLAKWAGVTL